MDANSFAIIAAVFLGPIAAVFITRWVDHKRLKHGRRMDVFRTLMRTRRMTLNPDHVGALNLVEIEFDGEQNVIKAWKDYFTHLGKKPPTESAEANVFVSERGSLLTKLLHAMAQTLKFQIEQLEIFEGGYTPQGWEDEEVTLRALRHHMLQIFMGNRALPVTHMTNAPAGSPFPPPPTAAR